MTAFEEIIILNGQQLKLEKQINELKSKAIVELYDLGYSYDDITRILHVGKSTAIKIIKRDD